MKVFWITNIPIGEIAVEMFNKPMGGLWMDAMLTQLVKVRNLTFAIATTSPTKEIVRKEYGHNVYYLLPGGYAVNYKRRERVAMAEWTKLFETEKPDVIQVWGTEYAHAIPALKVAKQKGIPSVIYIQGVMNAIKKYADGMVDALTRVRYITLRDVYRNQLWLTQDRWFKKCARVEREIFALSGNIIVENKWAEWYCKSFNPSLGVFRIPLNINDVFFSKEWSDEKMEPHSIVCNASGTAYKGLHVLLDALVLVKRVFPDVKLYVPGREVLVNGFFERQKKPGYYGYITDRLVRLGLEENVTFTGYLTPIQLSDRLARSNVFVLCSSIENHSSSLKEAMAIGTPAIASQVGGVLEYLKSGENGLSYRYEEPECLAGSIMNLFNDIDLCKKLSDESRKKAREYSNDDINRMILSMYDSLIVRQ